MEHWAEQFLDSNEQKEDEQNTGGWTVNPDELEQDMGEIPEPDDSDGEDFCPIDDRGEPEWVPFMSVDPGPVNSGVVKGEYRILQEQKVVEVKLFPKKGMKTIQVTSAKERDILNLNRDFKIALWKHFPEINQMQEGLFLVEKQYVTNLPQLVRTNTFWICLQLQLLTCTMANVMTEKFDCHVDFIDSFSYKTTLGIKTGNHSDNKTTALSFACSLLENAPVTIKDDHVADALNQFYYWCKYVIARALEIKPEELKIVWLFDESE